MCMEELWAHILMTFFIRQVVPIAILLELHFACLLAYEKQECCFGVAFCSWTYILRFLLVGCSTFSLNHATARRTPLLFGWLEGQAVAASWLCSMKMGPSALQKTCLLYGMSMGGTRYCFQKFFVIWKLHFLNIVWLFLLCTDVV